MKKFFKIISYIYIIFLTIVFLIPLDFFLVTHFVEKENRPSNNSSYLIHIIFFSILYLLFYFSFSNKLKIFLFCIFYSIILEFGQLFTYRGFQFFDILFNILGILISILLILFFRNLISIKSRK